MHDPFATRDPDPYATRDPNARVVESSTGDSPVPPFVDTPLDGDLTGVVAGYQILGELTRGGMGVVYRATDPTLQRTVAVKVLQEKYRGSPTAASRFLEEAQITAQLQHPGVPPVHQVGSLPDGRPFLAMKLIRGRTLAELLKDEASDRSRAVGTFEQICHTVAYAHDHGVIHRDLKPGNVMVGRFNEVQVMDWGLAKVRANRDGDPAATTAASTFHDPRAAGDDFETGAGSILGTPAYMPPEQAIGALDQVDERSDVFGLGAILCAILTGQPPYVGGTSESTRQLAARAKLDEAHARLAGSGADPELVALCRRCLSPEPADRPANAGEVAKAVAGLRAAADERARQADLDRVRAEGDLRAAEVRAAELRRRRRVQFALAAAVGMLLAGAGTVGWWADRQAGVRRAADLRRQFEEEQRAAAERERLDRTAAAVDVLLGQCEDALRADDTDRAAVALEAAGNRAAEGGADNQATRLARLRSDLALVRDLDRVDIQRWTLVNGTYPPVTEWGPGLTEAFTRWGLVPGTTALDEAARRVNESPVRDRVLTTLDLWVWATHSAPLADLLRAIDPDDFRDAVRAAIVAADDVRLRELADRPTARIQPTRFAAVLGSLSPLQPFVRIAFLDNALRARPGDFGLLMARPGAVGEVKGFGAPLNPEPWYRAAVAVRPKNAAARHNLGVALSSNGDAEGAVVELREAVRLDPNYFRAHLDLGGALQAQGDLPGAAAAYREAVRIDPTDAWGHSGLGNALLEQDDLTGAVKEFRKAVRLFPALPVIEQRDGQITLQPQDAFLLIESSQLHRRLGTALHRQQDLDAAITAYREAIRLFPWSAENNQIRYDLGHALFARGDLNGATAAFREVIRHEPKNAFAHRDLGVALQKAGDLAGAVAAFREAIQINPGFALAHATLGIALENQGDLPGAVAAFREAVRLDPKNAQTPNALAWLLAAGPDRLRDGKSAAEHATRACELSQWKDPAPLDTLAAAHAAAGDFGKAVEYQQKALAFPALANDPGARERLDLYRNKKKYYDPAFAPREPGPPPRVVKP